VTHAVFVLACKMGETCITFRQINLSRKIWTCL